MNAFDKHSKNYTAWCENCGQVFDSALTANSHKVATEHNLRIVEFWITARR
jgi:transcription elongation factor Elf1